jgi:hypothetical protein
MINLGKIDETVTRLSEFLLAEAAQLLKDMEE